MTKGGRCSWNRNLARASAPTSAVGKRDRVGVEERALLVLTRLSHLQRHLAAKVSRINLDLRLGMLQTWRRLNCHQLRDFGSCRSCQNSAIFKVRVRQVYRACEKCGISQLWVAKVFCSRFRTIVKCQREWVAAQMLKFNCVLLSSLIVCLPMLFLVLVSCVNIFTSSTLKFSDPAPNVSSSGRYRAQMSRRLVEV